jgi:hypothetical protein
MPRYRYALDGSSRLIDVTALPSRGPERAGPFACVSCGQPLIAKTAARLREKHFAHKAAQPGCNFETYLHKLAKEAFKEAFERCRRSGQPFEVELPRPVRCASPTAPAAPAQGVCPKEYTVRRWDDLTRLYDTARLEYPDGRFVPDLLLTDSSGHSPKLYVEIHVTHAVSQEKIASGIGILEIRVATEEDVLPIREARLASDVARAYNLAPEPVADAAHACRCDRIIVVSPEILRSARFAVAFVVRGSADRPDKQTAHLRVDFMGTLQKEWEEPPPSAPAATGDEVGSGLEQARDRPGIVFAHADLCSHMPERSPWPMPLTCIGQMKAKRMAVPKHCFLCRYCEQRRILNGYGYTVPLTCRKHRGRHCADETARWCPDFTPLETEDRSQQALSLE